MTRSIIDRFFVSLPLLAIMILMGCASHEKQAAVCTEPDWFEIGRRNGAKGLPSNMQEVLKSVCQDSQKPALQSLYSNGYQAGLVEYCSPENAFELGRTGQNYEEVCPKDMEAEFIKKFKQGRKLYRLQQANIEINRRIASIGIKIGKQETPESEKKSLLEEIQNLEQQRTQNSVRAERLEDSVSSVF